MKFPNYKFKQEKPPFPRFTFEEPNVRAKYGRQTHRIITARGYRGLTKAQMLQLRPYEGFDVLVRYARDTRGGIDWGAGVGTLMEVTPEKLELNGTPSTIHRGDIQYVDVKYKQTRGHIVRTRLSNDRGIALEHVASGYTATIVPSEGWHRVNVTNRFGGHITWLGDYQDEKDAVKKSMEWLNDTRPVWMRRVGQEKE